MFDPYSVHFNPYWKSSDGLFNGHSKFTVCFYHFVNGNSVLYCNNQKASNAAKIPSNQTRIGLFNLKEGHVGLTLQ